MEINDVYKCNICGNIVEITHVGGGTLVCCGQPMEHMKANTTDAAMEKHVPVIERQNNGVLVKVGAVPHPMEDKHHIEWIELVADGSVYKHFLGAGQKPEFFFEITAKHVEARAHCNLHGLWVA